MTEVVGEGPDPGALREEIRQAAACTGDLRRLALLGAGIFACYFYGIGCYPWLSRHLVEIEIGSTALVVGLFVGGSIALPLAAGYRALCRIHLRRRLEALPPAGRAEVLVSLEHDGLEDARKIVAPLLREMRGGELAPAPAPSPSANHHRLVAPPEPRVGSAVDE